MRGAYRIQRQSPHSYARHTLYTHCHAYPTRATHSRIHTECTSTQYTTQTHTRRRGRTHTARVKPKNKLAAAPEFANSGIRTQDSTAGARCLRRSAMLPTLCAVTIAGYSFGRRAEKHKGVLPKHNVKIFWGRRRRSPKPTTLDLTRTLEHTHTRMRVHTHTQHKLAIQTRLYTTNNSKQGINSITNLPMVPNTTKLKRNSTTTTELNRTSRSSTQTNKSALTKALKHSKRQERFKQQNPNNKELENTKTKP